LLQRRHVHIGYVKYIGKESNSLEEVEAGLIHSEQSVYTEYPDERRSEWQTKILPALKKAPLAHVLKLSGISRRAFFAILAGRTPHPRNQKRLAETVRRLGLI